MEVHEAGVHSFEANLLGAGGEPIAYVDESRPLEAGPQRVELRFFGRTIRERGYDGPYRVVDLRGYKRAPGAEATIWWHHDGTHRTHAYASTYFSGEAWDSPEKQERIRALEALAQGRDPSAAR